MTPQLRIAGVANARDPGGMIGSRGRVRSGVLLRSAEWTFATSEGQRALASLRMTHAADLRSAGERQWRPDPSIPGVTRLPIDVMGDGHGVSLLAKVVLEAAAGSDSDSFPHEPLLNDPVVAERELGNGRSREKLLAGYRSFSNSQRARDGLSQILTLLSTGHRVAIHCAAGKDRTGWAIATILLYLGVPYEVVLADYLRSREELGEAIRTVLFRAESHGVDPGVIEPLLMVREEYLQTFYNTVTADFGSIETYVEQGLGLGDRGGLRLRAALLES